jgi:hypothetical protein
MMQWRMLASSNPQQNPIVVNGRTYSASAGAALDVPDFDGQILQANGWAHVAPSGPTSARPAGANGLYPATNGAKFFDTTLGYIIEYSAGAWRNPATGAAV